MWYFAYGSNMNRQQVENRVRRVGLRSMLARLGGYTLRFNKKSTKDKSGKANAVPRRGGRVWGVVFELNAEEFERLREYEGGYEPKAVEVWIPEQGKMVRAETFLADADKADVFPSFDYLRLIVDGARQHGLPPDYCQRLARFQTKGEGNA